MNRAPGRVIQIKSCGLFGCKIYLVVISSMTSYMTICVVSVYIRPKSFSVSAENRSSTPDVIK